MKVLLSALDDMADRRGRPQKTKFFREVGRSVGHTIFPRGADNAPEMEPYDFYDLIVCNPEYIKGWREVSKPPCITFAEYDSMCRGQMPWPACQSARSPAPSLPRKKGVRALDLS
jgi:hypothetical protein